MLFPDGACFKGANALQDKNTTLRMIFLAQARFEIFMTSLRMKQTLCEEQVWNLSDCYVFLKALPNHQQHGCNEHKR